MHSLWPNIHIEYEIHTFNSPLALFKWLTRIWVDRREEKWERERENLIEKEQNDNVKGNKEKKKK